MGRRVWCTCLVREKRKPLCALWVHWGVFLHQTFPKGPRPGENGGASPEGGREAPLPIRQSPGLALGTAPPCGAARRDPWHHQDADGLPGEDGW